MVRCIRVHRTEGETYRRGLLEEGYLDLSHRIKREGEWILLPCTCDTFRGIPTEDVELDGQEQVSGDYRDYVDVPDGLRSLLPNSHDVVGDIAITKLDDPLLSYKEDIGKAMLNASPNLRAVFLDRGVKGEFRIRDLEKIAGTGSSETIHKEFGTRLKTDPSKVYFNPRLAGERHRVASLVRPGEAIIDMFAGVAPFGCVICRNARPSKVYSIDLNPACEYYMRENARLNHIDNMECFIGDSVRIVPDLPKADRVIMNLPQIADRFLDTALRAVKPTGTIHMHKIMEREEFPGYADRLGEEMADKGLKMRISGVSELKTYSPTMSVYVYDIVPGN